MISRRDCWRRTGESSARLAWSKRSRAAKPLAHKASSLRCDTVLNIITSPKCTPKVNRNALPHAPFARPTLRQTALKAQQRRHVRPGVFAAFGRKRAQPPFGKLPAIIEPKLKMGTHAEPKASPDRHEIEIGF